MTNKEKIEIILKHIHAMYPEKMILNATQTAKVIGISGRTLSRRIKDEQWDKLPSFKRETTERKDIKTNKYEFSIFDIAEFLARN